MPQKPSRYKVIAFENTHDAVAAQRLLAGAPYRVMPTSRAITAACGIALRVAPSDERAVAEKMTGPEWQRLHCALYQITDGVGERIEKLDGED